MTEHSNVTSIKPIQEYPLLLRAVWFLIIGLWFSGIWITVAWVLMVSIIGLPIGILMINYVPAILTLKRSGGVEINDGVNIRIVTTPQHGFFIRAVYFVVIGWWFSFIWASVGWMLSATIIGLPFGVLMLSSLPAVTTLQRG